MEHYRSTQRAWEGRSESVESGLSTQHAYADSDASVEQYRSTQAANTGLESSCGAPVLHTRDCPECVGQCCSTHDGEARYFRTARKKKLSKCYQTVTCKDGIEVVRYMGGSYNGVCRSLERTMRVTVLFIQGEVWRKSKHVCMCCINSTN